MIGGGRVWIVVWRGRVRPQGVLHVSLGAWGFSARLSGSVHHHCMVMAHGRYLIIDGYWLRPWTWHKRASNGLAQRRFYAVGQT